MADWFNISDSAVDPDAPITSELGYAFRDNPIAIAEGAAGAPSMLPGIAVHSAAGAVGTYMWASRSSGDVDVSFGSTLAGSSLRPTSAAGSVTVGSGSGTASFDWGAAQSGTWRAMGLYDHISIDSSSGTEVWGATLWIRIA